MSHSPLIEDSILGLIPEPVGDGVLTVLDAGMGYGVWGFLIKTRKTGNYWVEGLDVFEPYVEVQRKLGVYDVLMVQNLLDGLQADYDVILACELVEHDSKENGLRMLDVLESHCLHRLIVSTPNGYSKHKKHDDGNKYQEHKSGWVEDDFRCRGYDTFLVENVKYPKILKAVDRVRTFVFRNPRPDKTIIAYRDF